MTRAMTTARHAVLMAAAMLLALPATGTAQRDEAKAFEWNGRVTGDGWLRLRNYNGDVRITAGTSDRIEVVGTRRWDEDGNPEAVRFEVKQEGNDVVICALWETRDRGEATCGRRYRLEDVTRRARRVSVRFEVKLPRGVKVDASTINGDVDLDGATAPARAASINGSVDLRTTTGPAEASSVNGSVRAEMASLAGTESLEFTSVNGSVTVIVPDGTDADLEMSTVNGEFRTDFPLTMRGRFNTRRVEGTIGRGGRTLRLKTVNGDVELRKTVGAGRRM